MQGNENTPTPGTDGEDDGIGIEPVEKKSAAKAPMNNNTDSNPDKV
ncbi:MAG: hypothetical protein AABY88_10055 [Pseudomonadota bacterium]